MRSSLLILDLKIDNAPSGSFFALDLNVQVCHVKLFQLQP